MEILAGISHHSVQGALHWWTIAAVAGVLAALLYYGNKHLEKKYPHLKREKKGKKK